MGQGEARNPLLSRILTGVERLGNLLPDPAVLFVLGAALVMVLSQVGVSRGWEVQPVRPERVVDAAGIATVTLVPVDKPIKPVSLLTSAGLYWAISTLVKNFVDFPPLGVIVVCMLGVGVAERSGLIGTLLKALMQRLPAALLTPMVIFIGVNASLAADAGIIILPPLAAAMYKAAGRSPLAGIAAVYAGVSAGFSANILITSLDPLLASLTEAAARVVDPAYTVAPTCNWWFMIASTFLLTGVGWMVTARVIEPRLALKAPEEGGPGLAAGETSSEAAVSGAEARGLVVAGAAALAVLGVAVACALVPGWPLHGPVDATAPDGAQRWVAGLVPVLFFAFLVPGMAYGVSTGSLRESKDAARMMSESIASMAPVLVMCFFAAQFLKYFEYSNLGKMLAMSGGKALAASGLGPGALMVAFVLVVMLFNLLVTSASAKWAVFASIFVPMFMMVGISPELTQAAFRVGDSTTNIIAPMNAYIVVVLAVMQRFAPKSGLGTLMSLMLPYSLAFGIAWIGLLVLWMQAGVPLGIGGPLVYSPP